MFDRVQGYRCLECGDAFALEQSLAQHYDRRSLRIEVTCNHCAKRLAFFNKCSLLLHAREHKEKGLIMQCSHLVMKPVPLEQMISQQEPAAAGQGIIVALFLLVFWDLISLYSLCDCFGLLSPSLLSSALATSSSSVLGQAALKSAAQAHHAGPVKKEAEAVQYTGNKCPECQAQFGSKEEVSDHFQENNPAHSTVSLVYGVQKTMRNFEGRPECFEAFKFPLLPWYSTFLLIVPYYKNPKPPRRGEIAM